MIKTSSRLEGIGEYYFSGKLREIETLNSNGKDVINLGIGSPDLPPHPDVIEVLREESTRPSAHGYQSYKGSPVLRNAIGEWYKKWYDVHLDPVSEILPLMGSKEGIMHICMTYLEPGDEVLVPDPGYPTYSAAVKLAGGIPVSYQFKENGGSNPDFASLEKQGLGKVKLMFVNYPHMPTGGRGTIDLFREIVNFGKKNDLLIIHDNPYSFILNDQPLSMLRVENSRSHVLELNSLSKSHNMAGWRIGMLCGSKERIDEVLRFKSNMDSGMFLPLQLAAAKALSLGQEWYDHLNETYKKRRDKVFNLLHQLDCTFSDNQAGLFVWAKIPSSYKNGFELSDKILANAYVFITPGGIFGKAGENYVRVSLCNTIDRIEKAHQRVKEFLWEEKK